jgi:hypothetical protein
MSADERAYWDVYSDDPIMHARFAKLGIEPYYEQGPGKRYRLPANQLTIRRPPKVSQEERNERARRLKAWRTAK